jgi:hypothetical protein
MNDITSTEMYKLESNLALTQQIIETLRGGGTDLSPKSRKINKEAMKTIFTSVA